ncbi:MAG: LPS export ABC transporter periplasmic protein LptC [Candidatus Melainabacteria bacterium]|nr:MAG: LPS export ABC transporter periplasmic protein LptC [Candidatus Melainabacteria bacterium]
MKHDISSNDLEKQVVAIDSLLLTETKEGQKLWELYADKGEYESGSKIIILTNIIANFYQNGTVIASGKSTRGTYDTETKKVILYNDSCIVYKDGTSIHANLMEWEGKEKDVKAKDNVVIIKPNEYIIKSKKQF